MIDKIDLLHTSFLTRHSVRPEPVEGLMNNALRQAQGERNGLLQEVYFFCDRHGAANF